MTAVLKSKEAFTVRRCEVVEKLTGCLMELDALGEIEAAIAIDRAIVILSGQGGPLPADILKDFLASDD